MTATIKSGLAMLKILEAWGLSRLYGFPGKSLKSIVDALYEKRHSLHYIQTRNEESGAMAATAEARLSGRPAVCLAGAGAAPRLLSGLYEARAAGAPVLALIGLPPGNRANYGACPEMNYQALFADVSIFTCTVTRPESLPGLVDEALRRAMKAKGVAVLGIPDDLAFADIEDRESATAANYRQGPPTLDEPDLEAAVRLIDASRRPVVFAGQGAREAGLELVSLSDYFSLPIILSGPAKGLIADDEENHLGTAARLGTKPAVEALAGTDLILFIGSDFPYARHFFAPAAKCIQIDIDPAKLGARHKVEAAILGDAGEAMRQLIKIGRRKRRTKFLEACRENMKNWRAWLKMFENSPEIPMRAEPVFREINRIADSEAIFVAEPGNTLIHAARLLQLNGQGQRFLSAANLASTGWAVPGALAAKLRNPERQVFSLSGDGAFAMSLGDIATQVTHGLNIINIVFSNRSLGFIEAERERAKDPKFATALPETDFAKAAEAMGAKAYSANNPRDLPHIFDEARKNDGPVVINLAISPALPFPTEAMILDENQHGREAVLNFRAKHGLGQMPTLEQIFHSLPD